MEFWERDFEFLRVRTIVKNALKKDTLPDLQTILFLIGVQELGRIPKSKFTKEEKRDLMHIAVCTLMESEGYFEFEGRDQDGWPHWKEKTPFSLKGIDEQEAYLVGKIIEYFKNYNHLHTFTEH
ncbi:MAG: hypothetical protein WAT22_16565 [Saprospiraceae bacterium]|jgi:hypothetical protein|nr:hypothetical protein [Saprospiraceae bacterium]MBP6448114.1 hypothetical protein [Saprospiraceae bacterium]